jgi:hypothetical protein
MDELNEQTTQTERNPLAGLGMGLLAGGLGSVLGGAAGRSIAKKVANRPDSFSNEALQSMNPLAYQYMMGAVNPFPGVRKATKRMADEVAPGMGAKDANMFKGRSGSMHNRFTSFMDDAINSTMKVSENPEAFRKIAPDLGTQAGALYGGAGAIGVAPLLTGDVGAEKTGPDPEATSALQRIAAGNGSVRDQAKYADYYKKIQDAHGSGLGSYLATMGVAVPASLLLGGKAAHALGNRLAKKTGPDRFFKTVGGRDVATEETLDNVVGLGLGTAAGGAVYNATSDPYKEPFDFER